MVAEIWKEIEGVEVSNLGRVRAKFRGGAVRMRKLTDRGRYFSVYTSKGRTLVHALVAEAFLGPRSAEMEVSHKNGDRYDNRAANLDYVTHKENGARARGQGKYRRRGSLSDEQLTWAALWRAEGLSYRKIAERLNTNHANVYNRLKGKRRP
jgi:hypothetical protein